MLSQKLSILSNDTALPSPTSALTKMSLDSPGSKAAVKELLV
jgi:hypothetical protein